MILNDDNIIGHVGQGFLIAMDVLVEERWITGITSLAMARRALNECLKWSKLRMLNGRPMFHKQAVRLRLAKMKMLIDPLDSMAILLAGRLSVARNTSNMVPDLSADCAGFKAMCTSVLSKCIQSASILFVVVVICVVRFIFVVMCFICLHSMHVVICFCFRRTYDF